MALSLSFDCMLITNVITAGKNFFAYSKIQKHCSIQKIFFDPKDCFKNSFELSHIENSILKKF